MARESAGARIPVDQPAYLAKHDLVFLSPPTEGWEGLPLGNGDLGGMLWCTASGLRMQINKVDTWDQPNDETGMLLRSCAQISVDFGVPCHDWIYLEDFEGRLSLSRARADFRAQTPFARVSVRSAVLAHRNVLALSCRFEGTGALAEGGSSVRIALERWGSRAFGGWYNHIAEGATQGLGAARASARCGELCMTEQLSGLDFAVAARVLGADAEASVANARRAELALAPQSVQEFTVLLSVVTSNDSDDPARDASRLLDETEAQGIAAAEEEHGRWWEAFWRRSFVHIGDDYLENLYYLHLYLMGSSSRGRYPVVFNGGIWTWNRDVRQWVHPHHWNEQQAYWCLNAANHPELMRPYLDTYWRLVPKAEEYARSRGFHDALLWNEMHDYAGRMVNWDRPSFIYDWSPASQIGQYFWHYYLITGDETFLRDRAYPFMKKAAEVYLQYAQWGDDGKPFFQPASPFECESGNDFRNTTADLAMVRASFASLIHASRLLDTDAEKREQWQHMIDALPDYAYRIDPELGEMTAAGWEKDGRTVAAPGIDHGFANSTAPAFPTGILGLAHKGSRLFEAVARRVRSHPTFGNAIVPTAVVAARLGMADEAWERLRLTVRQLQHFPQGLFYNIDHWHYLSRYAEKVPDSQMYSQRDYVTDHAAKYKGIRVGNRRVDMPTQPFVQCGLEPMGILAQAVNEMLLQSYDGTIRVFPATPAAWPAAFTLRAVGGFLVTSERAAGGDPPWVRVESLLGNECRVVEPWAGSGAVVEEVAGGSTRVLQADVRSGAVVFPTTRGGVYLLRPAGGAPPAELPPAAYAGSPNAGPKRCEEAILGKERDF